jgi:trehalose transport system permease protein
VKARALLGLLPLATYLSCLTVAPVASTLTMSATAPDIGITLEHFRRIVTDYQFGEAVINTLAITGIGLTLELLLGLGAALALAGRPVGHRIFSILLLVPLGVPTVVSAAVMRTMFSTVGYLNEALLRLGVIRSPVDWTGERWLALATVAVADAWKVTPLILLILLAGLQAIPGDLYEAARTDGASGWRQFFAITLPLLKPAVTMALIVRGVDAFRIFVLPLALVGRGLPVLSTYAYVEYLEYGNPHTAAASSVILLVMILVTVLVYLKLAGPEEVLR